MPPPPTVPVIACPTRYNEAQSRRAPANASWLFSERLYPDSSRQIANHSKHALSSPSPPPPPPPSTLAARIEVTALYPIDHIKPPPFLFLCTTPKHHRATTKNHPQRAPICFSSFSCPFSASRFVICEICFCTALKERCASCCRAPPFGACYGTVSQYPCLSLSLSLSLPILCTEAPVMTAPSPRELQLHLRRASLPASGPCEAVAQQIHSVQAGHHYPAPHPPPPASLVGQ